MKLRDICDLVTIKNLKVGDVVSHQYPGCPKTLHTIIDKDRWNICLSDANDPEGRWTCLVEYVGKVIR